MVPSKAAPIEGRKSRGSFHRTFSCPWSCGTCASCPERCPWLGAGWKENTQIVMVLPGSISESDPHFMEN